MSAKRVIVGMSGGVDSSVSAYLLQKATPNNYQELFGCPTPEGFRGYEVIGAFIKTWSPDWLPCPWREERRDAMRVAAHLGIPFVTIDLTEEYKKGVADYLIDEYRKGRTPNPDVMCNKVIKFGGFLREAKKLGADFIATGHYARVKHEESRVTSYELRPNAGTQLQPTTYKLQAGLDTGKDQTYFLYTLGQKELQQTLFPVGHLLKREVREIARKAKLPVADKKDSQGICFLGDVDMKEFLKHYIETETGDVIDESGKKVGTHEGAILYTIGEHHIGYIISKDLERNILTVSTKRPEEFLETREVLLEDINWISGTPPTSGEYQARVRYRQPLQAIKLQTINNELQTAFEMPQTVASGQSVVLYSGDICLGGGIIR